MDRQLGLRQRAFVHNAAKTAITSRISLVVFLPYLTAIDRVVAMHAKWNLSMSSPLAVVPYCIKHSFAFHNRDIVVMLIISCAEVVVLGEGYHLLLPRVVPVLSVDQREPYSGRKLSVEVL